MPVRAVELLVLVLLVPSVLVFEMWICAEHCSRGVHCSLGFEAWSDPPPACLLCHHLKVGAAVAAAAVWPLVLTMLCMGMG